MGNIGSNRKKSVVLQFDQLSDDSYVKVHEAIKERVTPGDRSTTYRYIKAGKYPRPIKLDGNSSLIRVGSIRDWLRDPEGYKCTFTDKKTHRKEEI